MLRRIVSFVRNNGLLIAIVALGAALRLWGIGFGLPYMYHPDEGVPVRIALRVLREGNFNPGFFDWPSLLFYLNALAYGIYFVFGKLIGRFDTPQDLPYPDIITIAVGKAALPEELIISRALTAVAAAFAIVVIYLICRRVTGNRIAASVGALWLAVDPINIRHSQFIRPDIFVVVFSLAVCYFAMRIVDEPRRSDYVLAGISAGLAASSKYNGALIVIPIIIAHLAWFRARGWHHQPIIWAAIACILTFFATTPFALLEWQRFWQEGILGTAEHYATGHAGGEGETLQWYVSFLWSNQGWLLVLALAEIVAAVWTQEKKRIVLISFPLAYFAFVNLYTVRFETTILPVMPFVTLLAALFVARVYLCLSRRTVQRLGVVAVAGIAVIFALPMLQTAITHNQRILQPDSRETARVWIDQNLPAGSRIFIEPYGPYVDPQRYTVEGAGITEHPLDWYAQNGFEYLVFSYGAYGRFYEDRARYAETVKQYDEFFARFPEITRFNEGGYEIRIHKTNVTGLPTNRAGARFGIFGGWLELIGYDVKPAQAGKPIDLVLHWRTLAERRESITLTARLLDHAEREVAQAKGALFPGGRWQSGIVQMPVTIPAPSEPGMYHLELVIDAEGQGRVPVLSRSSEPVSDKLFLAPFKIAPAPISADELQRARQSNARFGDAFGLSAYLIQRRTDAVNLMLYWTSTAKVSRDYTIFIHLLDSGGNVRAQLDVQPRNGAYPTSLWDAGEIIRDDYGLTLPPDLAVGEYTIEIGMYEYPSLERLSISDANGNRLGDHLILDDIVKVLR